MQGFCQRLACSLSVVVLCAAATLARDVVIHTTDGRTIKGALVSEDDTGMTLTVVTVPFTIERERIRDVEYLETVAEQFAAERARLADDDMDGRFILVNDMIRRREYDLALVELDSMIEAAPEQRRLTNLRQGLIERRNGVKFVAQVEAPEPPAADDDPRRQAPQRPEHLLSEAEINVIRVYEIDLKAKPVPNVDVPREVVDKLFSDYGDNENVPKGFKEQAAFRRLPGYKQLEVIFAARARPLYSEVKVRRDPPVLANFRRKVHGNYVVNYCGAVACHGKLDNETGFTLIHDKRNRDDVIYTNFYILSQTDNADGLMINRDDPAKSLLVQYGLDRRAATIGHPETQGWKPAFRTVQMPQYKNLVQWIDDLWTPAPSYGLDFKLPGKKTEEDKDPAPGDDTDKNEDEQPQPAD